MSLLLPSEKGLSLLFPSGNGFLYYCRLTKDVFTIAVWQGMSLLLPSGQWCLYDCRLTKDVFTIAVWQWISLRLPSDQGFIYYCNLTRSNRHLFIWWLRWQNIMASWMYLKLFEESALMSTPSAVYPVFNAIADLGSILPNINDWIRAICMCIYIYIYTYIYICIYIYIYGTNNKAAIAADRATTAQIPNVMTVVSSTSTTITVTEYQHDRYHTITVAFVITRYRVWSYAHVNCIGSLVLSTICILLFMFNGVSRTIVFVGLGCATGMLPSCSNVGCLAYI